MLMTPEQVAQALILLFIAKDNLLLHQAAARAIWFLPDYNDFGPLRVDYEFWYRVHDYLVNKADQHEQTK